jgi:hypothetical protein
MLTPIRSLTLLHGLKLSNFATNLAPAPSVTRFSCTSGVLPTNWVTSLAILIPIFSYHSAPAGVETICIGRCHPQVNSPIPIK